MTVLKMPTDPDRDDAQLWAVSGISIPSPCSSLISHHSPFILSLFLIYEIAQRTDNENSPSGHYLIAHVLMTI